MSTALSAPQQIPTPEQPAQVTTENSAQVPEWKQQLAQRLDAYRAKDANRARHQEAISDLNPFGANIATSSRASSIARAVASRYASAPSYREMLLAAEQAKKAAEEAQKALAERAALDARIESEKNAARMQHEESALLNFASPSPQTFPEATETAPEPSSNFQLDPALPLFPLSAQSTERETAQLTGEQAFAARYGSPLRTQSGKAVMPHFAERTKEMRLHQPAREQEPSLEELLASSLVEPRSFLPSKLIEFPRELVSTHRARPRLAESSVCGPIPALQGQGSSHLRIFEVQAAPSVNTQALPESNVSTESAESMRAAHAGSEAGPQAGAQGRPDLKQTMTLAIHHATKPPTNVEETRGGAPGVRAFKGLEWAAISLDKEPTTYGRNEGTGVSDYMPFMVEPASIDRRLMAFAVDFAAVTAGFLGFLAVFVASTPHLPKGLTAVVLAGAVYAALWLLYQMLFFSLSGATAGMLYAHIALCTFDDQNPSRPALRRRLAAWWLSCLPLGMGFLWSFVDEDNLCWHDRITRTYQRIY